MRSQITATVSIETAKKVIAQAADIYFSKDDKGGWRMTRARCRPVCLMGPAGIGKTEIVRQVAEEKGLAFLSYSVTHHTRQSAIGLPRLTERTVDGKSVCVTEYTLSEIVAEVWRVMEESGKEQGILFLDEFNCASETLRPAMLQLLQSKRFGPHELPDGWMLVLAGNPGEYNASASALDPVMADRMRLLWLEPDFPAWRSYMSRRNAHPTVLSYLEDHTADFYVFENSADGTALVTARGWEDLSVMLQMMEERGFEVDLGLVAQFLQSGKVSRSFFHYYQQYSSLIASGVVDNIISGKSPKTTAKTVAVLDFSQSWALTSALHFRLEKICREQDGDTAEQSMNNVLSFYRAHFEGAPQLEFLLNRITFSDPCAMFLATHGCEMYRSMGEKLFFDTADPSVKKLKKTLSEGA